ncbi:ATP-binding protein [Actinocorallia aurantiaca]|uniref:Histidine kinase/HSP90-like ATPase domain-containing protein n=1 Tax=Actinocorallia aurantiaca TaxID=46204 RepID=A0ABN3UGS5_9ACTN
MTKNEKAALAGIRGIAAGIELNLLTRPAPDVPATVRSLLRLRLASWRVPADLAEDVLLAAVELVSNACDAAPDTEIAFRARLDPATGALWVGAWDTCPDVPTARRPELTLEGIDALPDDHTFGGWGLPLVAALAADCGVTRTADGKWVHAVFSRSPR